MCVRQVLEACMNDANSERFRNEIGRFKFLNEIVKLLSPTRAARVAPVAIRDRLMDLMLIWTRQYPRMHKIKDAYELLIKHGVPHVASKDHQIDRRPVAERRTESVVRSQFDDIPAHLWTSTDPADVQATNLMVEKALEKVGAEETEASMRQCANNAHTKNPIRIDIRCRRNDKTICV